MRSNFAELDRFPRSSSVQDMVVDALGVSDTRLIWRGRGYQGDLSGEWRCRWDWELERGDTENGMGASSLIGLRWDVDTMVEELQAGTL